MSVKNRWTPLAESTGINDEVGLALGVAAERLGVRIEGGALRRLVFGGFQGHGAGILHGPPEKVMCDRFVRKK